MNDSLARIESQPMAMDRPHPRAVIEAATEEANVLAEVIEQRKLYSVIQGKKFTKVEGWVTLATLRGCLPREVEVQEAAEGRYIAIVELVRMSDGAVLSRASAECGGPEDPIWAKRPPNARRSMAITRATGKVCRVGFSWVMVLAGFQPTPAEEMDFVQEAETPKPRSENSAVRAAAAAAEPVQNLHSHDFAIPFPFAGREKGSSMTTLANTDLEKLAAYFEKAVRDESKSRYKADNKDKMDRCLTEKLRRSKNAMDSVVAEDLPF